MESIGVIDYGMGNLHSLAKSLERVGDAHRVEISYDPEKLLKCDRLVLPGVGGVRGCMNELRRLELDQMVIEAAQNKPLLGICLGMQVLLDRSDENDGVDALGLIPGTVTRFEDPAAGEGERLKVPHMGWNQVQQDRAHPLWQGVADQAWFYFVHSYYAKLEHAEHSLGSAEYGARFCAAVAKDNVAAFQFHPEKSHNAGMTLLSNFIDWDGTV